MNCLHGADVDNDGRPRHLMMEQYLLSSACWTLCDEVVLHVGNVITLRDRVTDLHEGIPMPDIHAMQQSCTIFGPELQNILCKTPCKRCGRFCCWIIGHNACLYLLTIHSIPDIPDKLT
jgi:hypothetical protein